jgi:hypothetical protein
MARGEPQKTQEGDWRQAYSERRFGVLLAILVVLVAGPPMLLGFGLLAAWFDGLMALLMVAAILSLCFEHHQRLFALLLGISPPSCSPWEAMRCRGKPAFRCGSPGTYAKCCSCSGRPC